MFYQRLHRLILPVNGCRVYIFVVLKMDSICSICRTGLLVPDLPLEETSEIRAACHKVGLEMVLLVTPTTPTERMDAIAKATEGFVYLVSVTGVTGVRAKIAKGLEGLISRLHGVTNKSVRQLF